MYRDNIIICYNYTMFKYEMFKSERYVRLVLFRQIFQEPALFMKQLFHNLFSQDIKLFGEEFLGYIDNFRG